MAQRAGLKGAAHALYEQLNCARDEMENRIKELQLDLFADRTSCHHRWPSQFRLLLSSLVYMLLEAIRRLPLQCTALANAYVGTLRLKLLKVGVVILRNTRKIRFSVDQKGEQLQLESIVRTYSAQGREHARSAECGR